MIEYNQVFLDTAPIIYFLDDDINYAEKMEQIFQLFLKEQISMCTSAITCTEYLTYPYRTGNIEKVNVFHEFIADCNIPVFSIDMKIAKKAAQIRAEYKYFKTMDCLQLATAYIQKCDLFLTNDKQLCQFKEISCITIDNFKIN